MSKKKINIQSPVTLDKNHIPQLRVLLLTVDERISDGYCCLKSIRLLKKLPTNPRLLKRPIGENMEY